MFHTKARSGVTRSPWMDVRVFDALTELHRETTTDVCVIGAGVAGLSTALQLLRLGKRVIVLEAGSIGGRETMRTTAHLSSALDDRFHRLEKLHGLARTRMAATSHRAAIDWIEAFVQHEGVDCGFERVDGFLFAGESQEAEELTWELAAARRAGFEHAELTTRPLGQAGTVPCLRFPDQAQLHPGRYLRALARAVVREGGELYAGACAESIEGDSPRVLVQGDKVVTCDAVVVTTNVPVSNRVALHTKLAAYRTYVVGIELPRRDVPRALYWDTADPYHYVRLADLGDGRELLIVGGEDARTGQHDDGAARWARLEQWARHHFPSSGEVLWRWSGQIFEPADGLAYIGQNPGDHGRVYVATGDSGHGMTHGTIAGMLLSAQISGRESPWAELYDPSRRVPFGAIPTFVRENVSAASHYAAWLKPAEATSARDLLPGQSAILRRGLKRIAVHREVGGECHAVNARCTHLGGVVAWNSAERTWDCPLHGSRFDVNGGAICGPAIAPLEPVTDASVELPRDVPGPREDGSPRARSHGKH